MKSEMVNKQQTKKIILALEYYNEIMFKMNEVMHVVPYKIDQIKY